MEGLPSSVRGVRDLEEWAGAAKDGRTSELLDTLELRVWRDERSRVWLHDSWMKWKIEM